MEPPRCSWVDGPAAVRRDPALRALYRRYHDEEWGVPVHDDRTLFEFLLLEGFQAGLSWLTVLRKRDAFRRAFADFDPERVAAYGETEVQALLGDAGIVRNGQKIRAAVTNARAFLRLQEDEGSFARYSWDFIGGEPLIRAPRSDAEVPATIPLAESWSRDLRRRGFTFVGPTIVYAHMQATGMVMDHLVGCFRYRPLSGG